MLDYYDFTYEITCESNFAQYSSVNWTQWRFFHPNWMNVRFSSKQKKQITNEYVYVVMNQTKSVDSYRFYFVCRKICISPSRKSLIWETCEWLLWYVNGKYADESIRLSFKRDNVEIVFHIQICVPYVCVRVCLCIVNPKSSLPLYHCQSHTLIRLPLSCVYIHIPSTHTHIQPARWQNRISDLSTTKHRIRW